MTSTTIYDDDDDEASVHAISTHETFKSDQGDCFHWIAYVASVTIYS